MSRPVRLAVIGTGMFGLMHLRCYKQLERAGRATLVAAAHGGRDRDRAEARAREFGVRLYDDYRAMLAAEALDGVSIVTPDHLHREMAEAVLSSGRHALVEKPLDTTVAGCAAIIRLAAARGLLVQVDFHKRYDPYHIELAALVRAGRLGRVLYGYAHMEDRIEVPADWFPHWAPSTSPAWFLGVHFYDLARWVLGSEPVRVNATGSKVLLAARGIDTYDAIQARVDFADGASVSFDTSWILPRGFEAIVNQGIRLVGTAGLMEVDTQDRGARSCLEGEGMRTHNLGFFQEVPAPGGGTTYRGYGLDSIAHFVDNIAYLLDGGALAALAGSYPDGTDGLAATRIAAAVHESLDHGGTPVTLDAPTG
jgi:predicted dehydrogenase